MRGRKPVVQCTRSEWRSIVHRIQSAVSPPEGYVWRFIWSTSLDDERNADAELRTGRAGRRGLAIVRVARGLSEAETAERVIHEVAHLFDTWTHHGWAGDHSETWGIWYARVYCRYWGVS